MTTREEDFCKKNYLQLQHMIQYYSSQIKVKYIGLRGYEIPEAEEPQRNSNSKPIKP